MNSRVSWSVDGIDPSVRERAEAAARRAGMSLNDWLNSTLGESAPPNFRNPPLPPSPSHDVADIHQRLDSITRQIERISQPTPRNDAAREQGVARQLNDAISRLDARLSQISNPQAQRQNQNRQQRQAEAVERAASQVYAAPAYPSQAIAASHPQAQPAGLSQLAAAEPGLARLCGRGDRRAPERARRTAAARDAAAPGAADRTRDGRRRHPRRARISRRWNGICSRSRARSRRCSVPISSSRSPRSAASSAKSAPPSPRRCRAGRSSSIESEIRSLSRRIDDSRQSGIDGQVLANIERALAEIREVLRSLKSAEQLAGYDEAIRNLGAKLDMILRANDDPGTVQQLESAIAALRAIVSNVASNDALVRLSDDVQTAVVEGRPDVARRAAAAIPLPRWSSRIAALTSALESRERPQHQDNSEQIEGALRAPVRPHRPHAGRQRLALPPLHISSSASPICSSGWNPPATTAPAISAASRTACRTSCAISKTSMRRSRSPTTSMPRSPPSRTASSAPPSRDDGLIDLVKRELSDIRFSQTKTDRQTQDSLEAVHSTLRPCGRSACADRGRSAHGALRRRQPPRAAPALRAGAITSRPPLSPAVRAGSYAGAAMTPRSRNCPILPQARRRISPPRRAISTCADRSVPPPPPVWRSRTPPPPPLAISEILVPTSAPRSALAPDLPPDHPLEPGTRPARRVASPSERIAASEERDQRNPGPPRRSRSRRRASSPPPAARRRRPPPSPRPTRAAVEKADKAKAQGYGERQGRRQGALDRHLEDPLAAGRRERGRDRARHLQDGDEPARTAARRRGRRWRDPPISRRR